MIFEIMGTEIVVIGDEMRYVPIITEIEAMWEIGDNEGLIAALERQDNEDDQGSGN